MSMAIALRVTAQWSSSTLQGDERKTPLPFTPSLLLCNVVGLSHTGSCVYMYRCDMFEDSDDANDHSSTNSSCNHRRLHKGLTVMSRSNVKEASLVVKYAESLVVAGVRPGEIAVITPYNGQVDAVKTLFAQLDIEKNMSVPAYATIEVL